MMERIIVYEGTKYILNSEYITSVMVLGFLLIGLYVLFMIVYYAIDKRYKRFIQECDLQEKYIEWKLMDDIKVK